MKIPNNNKEFKLQTKQNDTSNMKGLKALPAKLVAWAKGKANTGPQVISVPVVEAVNQGQFISHRTVDLALSQPTDAEFTYYTQTDNAMAPTISKDALVLATDQTTATDDSLVVILADGSSQPLIRRMKYTPETALFLPNDLTERDYTAEDARVLGDVVGMD